MAKGDKFPPEKKQLLNDVSASRVYQLTDAQGWHVTPYFTNTAFTPDSRRIAFNSERGGKTDIYCVDVESGDLVQLTDITPDFSGPPLRYFPERITDPRIRCELVSWVDDQIYYSVANKIHRVDMNTLEEEFLWEFPENIVFGRPHMNAEGTHLVFPAQEIEIFNIPDEQLPRRQHFVWKRVKEHPELSCYIYVLEIDTGKAEVWLKENAWFTHVQFSPLDSSRVLYCHEGVWEDEDERMWMFDRRTGEKWNVRKQTEDVCIGHEMWIPGTERILYHGWIGDDTMVGFINPDNTERVEYRQQHRFYGHFCTNKNGSVIVTDAGIYDGMISLVTFENDKIVFTPLCRHDNIWKHPEDHPHPRFSPDEKWIVFTASHSPGNSNIYVVEMPERFRT